MLDTSGSMRGEKIEQARAAHRLLPAAARALAIGSTSSPSARDVTSFRDALAENTPANAGRRREVRRGDWWPRVGPTSAARWPRPGRPDRRRAGPRIAIFLTDGTPTAGELVPEKIVEQVEQANTAGTRIFVMGVGHDVNAHLLDQLAETTDGSSEYAGPGEEMDAKIAALYDRLAHPVLTGVTVSFGELVTNSVYPQKLPVLFQGSEVMIAGRYRGGGPATFTVSGTLAGQPVQYACRGGSAAASQRAGQRFRRRRCGPRGRSATCSRRSACTARTRS